MKGQEVMKYLPFLTVICLGCFAAASAEAGAKLCGDVDGDQDVDITDAMLVAQYYNGMNPSGFNADVADVDGSGDITIVDALLMAQYYVGLIDRFPAVDLSAVLAPDQHSALPAQHASTKPPMPASSPLRGDT